LNQANQNSKKEPIRHKEINSANPLLKEYFIKSLYDSCYDNFDKENPNSLSGYSKKNYCECYVQDISQKLTTEDIESFYKPGDYKPSLYLQIIINHVSKECMKNEINKK